MLDALKTERDQLTERLTSMMAERERLSAALQSQSKESAAKAKEAEAKAGDLQKEMEALLERENKSQSKDRTSITATFLRVTVSVT